MCPRYPKLARRVGRWVQARAAKRQSNGATLIEEGGVDNQTRLLTFGGGLRQSYRRYANTLKTFALYSITF